MLYKLSCYLCKSYGVMITLVYGMYVHIKVVTYITFPNKQDFLPKLISTRGNVKHVSILAVCPYNVCDVLHCQLNMALDQAC